ncbi:Uncharacterised protein [Klebsiella pneumoniae]|nr:Uncharacterised protein [Klebsiella pneumoniae]
MSEITLVAELRCSIVVHMLMVMMAIILTMKE